MPTAEAIAEVASVNARRQLIKNKKCNVSKLM